MQFLLYKYVLICAVNNKIIVCNQNRKYVTGFSSPESIFAEKNTYFLFCNQNRKYVIFPKIALFHINCYFIGKVSPMYGFLAGFSSPESIFAENNTYFLFVTKTGNM